MKRLLCLVSGMNAGGAETFLMKIYRKLDRLQYQMDFCVNIKEKGYYDDEIIALGGKIYNIPPKSESPYLFKKELTRIIRDYKYEYVLRITSNAAGFWDLKIAKDAGAKVCIARSSNSSDGGGLKKWLAHRIGRLLYMKYVDIKIAPSDLAAVYTFGKKAVKENKVIFLKNAIDLEEYTYSGEARNLIRKEFGLADEFVVGHIGRFNKQKNHEFLLNIFKAIIQKQPNARLVLVGKGILEPEIKRKAKELGIDDKIIYTGLRKDIPQILSAFDVFVFPSLYEGMPNTVIEAQATGLPCIISDTITKEANVTNKVKYLSLYDNPEKWADNILKTAVSDKRKNTGEILRFQGYDITDVANNFISHIFER